MITFIFHHDCDLRPGAAWCWVRVLSTVYGFTAVLFHCHLYASTSSPHHGSSQLAASLNYVDIKTVIYCIQLSCIYLDDCITEVSVTSLSIHYCDTSRPEQLPDTTEDREGDCCSSCAAVCSHKPDHCSGERCSPGPCMRTADVTCSLCSHSNSAVSGKWSLVFTIIPPCTSSRCDLG